MTNKLNLTVVLNALDKKERNFYNSLTDEEKKSYVPLILMRYMSLAPDQNDNHLYHILMTNDFVNVDFWQISKHPELQHLLLSIVGTGKKQFHQWLAGPKRVSDNKINSFLLKIYPFTNQQELELLKKQLDKDKLENLCKDYGLQDNEIKDILKAWK